jgi:hypothetical protein
LATQDRDLDVLVDELANTAGFRAAVTTHLPHLLTEVDALAAAAGCTRDEAFAVNCLDEAWWWADGGAGCSVVADLRSGLAGQNMDLDTWMDGTQVVLRLAPDDGPRQVLLSRAGLVGLCGANDAGLVVLVNTLDQLPVDPDGVPVAFVLRALTGCRQLDEAVEVLHRLPHASGQAYTFVTASAVRGFECGAGVVQEYMNDERLDAARWHTNHPVAVERSDADDSATWASGSSGPRYDHLTKTLTSAEIDADALESLLCDGEAGICMFPGRWRDNGFTFGSFIAELTTPPSIRIALGPPDRTPYAPVPFC